jgi:prepilin-type N-terminal cleavage/methylation domain-containing protein
VTEQRGFSLIELAIVLVIITILIGGLAVPLSAQIQARRIGETKQAMQEAREALFGYAMTHPASIVPTSRYLPCPDIDGDGHEDRVSDSQCSGYQGFFPWADLGAAPQDAWGNRLGYAVVVQFINRTKGFSASSPTSTEFTPLRICTTHTCSADVATDVVFVLVSYGPNGWGARNISGSTLAAPTGLDEAENVVDGNLKYVSRFPTKADSADGEFDDLIVWASRSALIARVCPTGCPTSP